MSKEEIVIWLVAEYTNLLTTAIFIFVFLNGLIVFLIGLITSDANDD